MKEPDTKKCNICSMVIYELDEYCRLTEFSMGKSKSEGYYHVTCFREKFLLQTQRLNQIMNKTNLLFDRIGV